MSGGGGGGGAVGGGPAGNCAGVHLSGARRPPAARNRLPATRPPPKTYNATFPTCSCSPGVAQPATCLKLDVVVTNRAA